MNKKFYFLIIVFFIAFGCVKQNLDFYSDEETLNADTRAWVQIANTPSIKSASLTANDKAVLDQKLSKYTAFTIDEKEVAGYFREGSGSVRLQINEELDWTIRLELNDLRDPDYKAFYITEEGEFEVTEPFVVNTFKGETSTGQHVRFTIDDNTLFGVIFGEDYHYVIRSANDYMQNNVDSSFIVYKNWDVIPDYNVSDYIHDALEAPKDYSENLIVQGATTRSNSNSLKVATDADLEFHNKYGTVAATNSYILTIINIVDGVYTSTFGLRLYVTDQYVFTTTSTSPAYPYTSSNADILLDSFRTYWNTYRTSVNRNIAHLFTGKTMTVPGYSIIWGVSYPGGNINGNTLGNKAYSVSMYDTYMEYTVTHEIGHNLGATEANLASPPTPTNCNCSLPTRTVMCQGGNIPANSFCPYSISQIQGFFNTAINSGQLSYINGDGTVYYPYAMSYSLNNAPPGTITWSITGPYTLSSTTGSTTSVTKTSTTGSGTLKATVNGTIVNKLVAEKDLVSVLPLINGPDIVYAGQTYVSFRVPDMLGATYNWSSSGILTLASGNGFSEGLFNVPYSPSGSDDTVSCLVTLNGVNTPVYKFVSIY